MRRILYICVMAFLVSLLPAQELREMEGQNAEGFFPLALILEEAQYAGNGHESWLWRPDWPLELPPDLFRAESGEYSKLSIEIEDLGFIIECGPDGRLEEFPFMLGGRVAWISINYDESRKIRKMILAFSPNDKSWEMEFLEYKDSFPSLVRASHGDAWYFISLSKGGDTIMETWYDEEGNMLTSYGYSLTDIGHNRRIRNFRDYSQTGAVTEYFYDSRCLLSDITGQDGDFSVLYYRNDLPRYWERRPRNPVSLISDPVGKFSFQWDRNDLLLRIVRVDEDSAETDSPAEYRYEYSFDEAGNWTERREIRMFRRLGLLVPSPGMTIRRVVEYR